MPQNRQLKLATYNILYGLRCNSKFLHYISADHQRYTEIVEYILPNANMDILFLNEVTKESLGYILQSNYVRNNYIVNEVVWGGGPSNNWGEEGKYSFGNIILSKFYFEWTFLGVKTRLMSHFPVLSNSLKFIFIN
jgi:endonuclease/exonuclease/phosphatase family metal-dependent hydrolase